MAELKKRGYTAEYVSEYAKDLVYALKGTDENIPKEEAERLLDMSAASQDIMLDEQKRRMDRLVGQVEYVVTDAPVLFNNVYCKEGTPEREQKVRDIWNSYDNISFFVNRDMSHFETEGRIHNFEESVQKDKEIRNMLKEMNIEYTDFSHGEIEKLANKIEGKKYIKDDKMYAFRTNALKNGIHDSSYVIFMDADEARERTHGNWERENEGLCRKLHDSGANVDYDNVLSQTERTAIFTYQDKPYRLKDVRKIEAIRNGDMADVTAYMNREDEFGKREQLKFETTWERANEIVNLEEGILRAEDTPKKEASKKESKSKKTNKTRDLLIEQFVSALEENQLPWRQSYSASRYSVLQNKNATTGNPYRGVNQLTLEAVAQSRGYRSDQWLTFSQLKNKGYSFRKDKNGHTMGKGAGVPIEVYKPYDRSTKKVITFDEYNEIMRGDDEEHKKSLTMFAKNYMVFNGDLVNELYKARPEVKLDPDIERAGKVLETYAANEGIEIYNEPVESPYYSNKEDNVHMPPREDYPEQREYLQDLSHELSHSTMSRVDRNYDYLTMGGRAREELAAEIGASFTMAGLEVPPVENHGLENTKAYVQSWIQMVKDKPEALFAAISDAQKAADYILDKGEKEKIFAQAKEKESVKEAEEKKPEKTRHPFALEVVELKNEGAICRYDNGEKFGVPFEKEEADHALNYWLEAAIENSEKPVRETKEKLNALPENLMDVKPGKYEFCMDNDRLKKESQVSLEIDPSWSEEEKRLGKEQLEHYGGIFLKYGDKPDELINNIIQKSEKEKTPKARDDHRHNL